MIVIPMLVVLLVIAIAIFFYNRYSRLSETQSLEGGIAKLQANVTALQETIKISNCTNPSILSCANHANKALTDAKSWFKESQRPDVDVAYKDEDESPAERVSRLLNVGKYYIRNANFQLAGANQPRKPAYEC